MDQGLGVDVPKFESMNQSTLRSNSPAKERRGHGLDGYPYMTQRDSHKGQSDSKLGFGSGTEDSDFTIKVTIDDIALCRTTEVLPI